EHHFRLEDMGRRMGELIGTARSAAAATGEAGALPIWAAHLFTTEIIEQKRWADHAAALAQNGSKIADVAMHTVQWKSLCEAGRVLARCRLQPQAMQIFNEAVRTAEHCPNQKIQFSALVQIGKEVLAIDPDAASKILDRARSVPAEACVRDDVVELHRCLALLEKRAGADVRGSSESAIPSAAGRSDFQFRNLSPITAPVAEVSSSDLEAVHRETEDFVNRGEYLEGAKAAMRWLELR